MFQNTDFISIYKLFESEMMDKYYEKNFGIKYGHNEDVSNPYEVVVKVGKYRTPIILNPPSLEGFDPDVRAISDQNGNLYVAYKEKYFNHGTMANALIKAGVIDTFEYNEEAQKASDTYGVYIDQKHFLILNRFKYQNLFVPSDCFEWEGTYSEKLLKAVEEKNPQFKFDMEYWDTHKEWDLDENIRETFYPKLFKEK